MAEVIVINPRNDTKVESDELIRVAPYIRVSSDSEDQENSFVTQYDYYMNKILSTPQYTLVDVYADKGISGTELKHRDDFIRMYNDCAKGKIDLIIVKSVSRFARNTYDCIDTVRKLKQFGTNVVFEKEGFDTRSMTSELELAALSSIAQEESVSISKNMKISLQFRMKNGTYKQGTLPYGYDIDLNGNWIINEKEARVVRLIFRAYINGTSSQQITDQLREADVKQRDDTYISRNGVMYILRNERYTGDALFQKTFTEDFPFTKKHNKGEKDKYYVKNHHPAIITHEEFGKAKKRLDEQSKKHIYTNSMSEHPLSKKIYCKECGSLFRIKPGTVNVYVSCGLHDRNSTKCPTIPIAEDTIYKGFIDIYNRLLSNSTTILSPILYQLNECKNKRFRNRDEMENINKQIVNITEQILVLGKAKSQGYIESAIFMQETSDLSAKLGKLKREKKSIIGEDEYDEAYKKTQQIVAVINAKGAMGEFDKDIFNRIIKKIEVDREKIITYELINGMKIPYREE